MKYKMQYLYLYALNPLEYKLACYKNYSYDHYTYDIHILFYGKIIDKIHLQDAT